MLKIVMHLRWIVEGIVEGTSILWSQVFIQWFIGLSMIDGPQLPRQERQLRG